jgi:hypothetical protein
MPGRFKPSFKDHKTGTTKRTAKWYGWYRDKAGKKCRVPLCKDKAGAMRMLTEHLQRLDREAAGLIDPFEEHQKRPLSDHLAEWKPPSKQWPGQTNAIRPKHE